MGIGQRQRQRHAREPVRMHAHVLAQHTFQVCTTTVAEKEDGCMQRTLLQAIGMIVTGRYFTCEHTCWTGRSCPAHCHTCLGVTTR